MDNKKSISEDYPILYIPKKLAISYASATKLLSTKDGLSSMFILLDWPRQAPMNGVAINLDFL